MKPICLIAARGGSRGVPGKNVRLFAGKPLIAHTIVSSLKSNIFSHVIVSTDNKEIARIAKKYGAEVPFLRPKNISSNKSSMAEVIEHTISPTVRYGVKGKIYKEKQYSIYKGSSRINAAVSKGYDAIEGVIVEDFSI